MTEYLLGDLRTGRGLIRLNPFEGPWTCELNGAGTIGATLSLKDPATRRLQLRNAATVGKALLAVVENDVILNAGPVWTHRYSKDDAQLELAAAGVRTYFQHRLLIPVLAASTSPLDPLADTTLSLLSLGTMAKRLVQQAQTHTGGALPIVFGDDEASTLTRTWLGSDLGLIDDALQDLTAEDGGPDLDFTPEWTPDHAGVQWRLRTGTVAKPQLSSPSVHVWDYSVPRPAIRGLEVSVDGSKLAGRAWVSGGRSTDSALYARFESSALTGQGYPLLEAVSSSSADDPAVLDGYARELARTGSKPTEFWSFEVAAGRVPMVGQYRPGDFCDVTVAGDPYIPDGTYRRRITNISGDEAGRWIKVTTGEVFSLTG